MPKTQSALSLLLMNTTFGMLLATPVQAATTYYVATNGNDSNPGTLNQPFATLNHAASKAEAGDTVQVREGTYYVRQTVWLGGKGNESAPIVFESYPGETAILDGKNLPNGNEVIGIGGQHIDIKNFEVRNSTRVGISVWGGKHIQILNNTVYNSREAGIFAGYTDKNTVTDVRVEGNTVYNNCLVNSSRNQWSWPAGITASGKNQIRITNNKVYNNYGEGIVLLGSGGLVSENTVYDNYSVGIYLDRAQNSTVEKNLIYTTNNSNFYKFDQPASGIQLANEGDDNKLINNKIINNIVIGGREGFSYYSSYGKGGGLKNSLIANNTFYKATGTLLLIQEDAGHTNTKIANNIFYQTGGGAMTDVPDDNAFSFQNNNWFGGSAGLAAGSGDVNADPLFVKLGSIKASDFIVTVGSPVINKGTRLNQVSTDYAGSSRPLGQAYDIGAYEYF